uniref:Uncharacterized protein n=1 Tax=Triticum urartu TaxID=4572 RepID=A0A8R7RF21_TRIUA
MDPVCCRQALDRPRCSQHHRTLPNPQNPMRHRDPTSLLVAAAPEANSATMCRLAARQISKMPLLLPHWFCRPAPHDPPPPSPTPLLPEATGEGSYAVGRASSRTHHAP